MNEFAKRNFNLILLLSTVAGFVVPPPGEQSGPLILGVLCLIIFASSFNVDFSLAFFRGQARAIAWFYAFRFLLLPVLLYGIIAPFSPVYAACLFLLSVLPAGVTSPAFTNVFGGNVALALALLILSSALTPLVLPYLGSLLMAETLTVDLFRLFTTLFITVIVPYAVHVPFRRRGNVRHWMQTHDSFISILGIALIFTLAIAEYRPVLRQGTAELVSHAVVSFLTFVGLYVVGWWALPRADKADKLALLFSSGANNVALGVVISFLYFPHEVGVFFVVCEIVWVVILIPVRRLIARRVGA